MVKFDLCHFFSSPQYDYDQCHIEIEISPSILYLFFIIYINGTAAINTQKEKHL